MACTSSPRGSVGTASAALIARADAFDSATTICLRYSYREAAMENVNPMSKDSSPKNDSLDAYDLRRVRSVLLGCARRPPENQFGRERHEQEHGETGRGIRP